MVERTKDEEEGNRGRLVAARTQEGLIVAAATAAGEDEAGYRIVVEAHILHNHLLVVDHHRHSLLLGAAAAAQVEDHTARKSLADSHQARRMGYNILVADIGTADPAPRLAAEGHLAAAVADYTAAADSA